MCLLRGIFCDCLTSDGYGLKKSDGIQPYSHTAKDIDNVSPGRHIWPAEKAWNYYKFAPSGESQTIRAYPLKNLKTFYYEVSINEHLTFPVIEIGKTVRIPVATINVHNYKSSLQGQYIVYSDKNEKGKLEEYFPKKLRSEYVENISFPTETSLFFPFGYTFRLDFYAKDDVEQNVLQDQVVVDLTHE